MCGGNSSKNIIKKPYQVILKAVIPSGVGIQKEKCCLRLLLMVFFFFNQRVISASNDAPKTISRDSMIAGRSHLSIYLSREGASERDKRLRERYRETDGGLGF